MPYCTAQHLTDRFGATELIQLTDRALTGSIDFAVLDQAIADADAEINGYLTAYPLPLAVVPANLIALACDITRYRLCDDQLIEVIVKRYERAIRYLEQVAAGKVSLGADATGQKPPEPAAGPVISSDAPAFVSAW